jgi:hypothetical protein
MNKDTRLMVASAARTMTLLSFFGILLLSVSRQCVAATVPVTAPGWIWSGMVEYDDPEITGGQARAGGPGTYGAYSFKGQSVQIFATAGPVASVDGRRHRMGSIKVSIDGHVKAEVSVSKSDFDYNFQVSDITGLSDGIHVVQVEPSGGWAIVNGISVDSATEAVDNQPASNMFDPAQDPLTPVVIPEGTYRIFPVLASQECLDVLERGTSDGTPLQVWIETMTVQQPNQWFHVFPLGHSRYRFSPLNNQIEAVTAFAPDATSTEIAGIWHYAQLPSQSWVIQVLDDGGYRLTPSNAGGMALTLTGGQTADGTRVICAPWKASPSQEWQLTSHQ